MVLIMNDMFAFSTRAKHRYRPRMLFIYNVRRVSCGNTFSASGGRDGRLGREWTQLKVLVIVSMYGAVKR